MRRRLSARRLTKKVRKLIPETEYCIPKIAVCNFAPFNLCAWRRLIIDDGLE